MKNKNHQMRLMTVEEVQAYLKTNQTIILPYALCEQHGFHLPLDTDIRNAEYCSAALAEKLDCIVAPVLTLVLSRGLTGGSTCLCGFLLSCSGATGPLGSRTACSHRPQAL